MSLQNSSHHYGWLTIALHWVIALGVLSVFFLGLWMVTLDYYSTWYHQAPWVHKSLGVVLVGLMVVRWIWHRISCVPKRFENLPAAWMHAAVHASHLMMYGLVLLIGLTGYLISTAEGKPVSVFDWFHIAALPWQFEQQADWAGWWHQWLAYGLLALVVMHAVAALKHHFVDKDCTLKRMLNTQPY
ncbi:cytochrome b [Thiomicrospira sp. WB1]|uniref:cytochrome b n=1 Tax=Thiomicrospira sp. WB1 TaxID=1685380 RepID=UPI00074AD57D|nr:cytochrome b [Thiomicrospira sp. WB1]KUJ72674.1 cytochrome B [Thiomicrospira sp. WB1]